MANGKAEANKRAYWLDWVYNEEKREFTGWICSSCKRVKSVSYAKYEYCPCCNMKMENGEK